MATRTRVNVSFRAQCLSCLTLLPKLPYMYCAETLVRLVTWLLKLLKGRHYGLASTQRTRKTNAPAFRTDNSRSVASCLSWETPNGCNSGQDTVESCGLLEGEEFLRYVGDQRLLLFRTGHCAH